MKYLRPAAAVLVLVLGLPGSAISQTSHSHQGVMAHSPGMDHAKSIRVTDSVPTEPGQSAFAAIAEIVEIIRKDPETDWASVDVAALRQHLIDMDNVTLRATVDGQPIVGGALYNVIAEDPAVTASIRRTVVAHAATVSGVDGMQMRAEEIAAGARLTVTGANADMIRGLGFIGLMTTGMHHQAHHLALARGYDPHQH